MFPRNGSRDPEYHQNETDPQHFWVYLENELSVSLSLVFFYFRSVPDPSFNETDPRIRIHSGPYQNGTDP